MNKKIARILGIILIAFIMIFTLTGCGKEKENETEKNNNNVDSNNEPKTAEVIELTTGIYAWSNPTEEYKETFESGMSGGTIKFNKDKTFIADIGNGHWIEGIWEQQKETIICKDIEFNSEWSKEPEKVEFEMSFKVNDKEHIEIISNTGTLEVHTIDMTTGERLDETKEMPIEGYQAGNIYLLEEK